MGYENNGTKRLSEGTRAIIREIAWEVVTEQHKQVEKQVELQIKLHKSECEANKYKGWKTFFSASAGGGIAIFLKWLMEHF